jgi:plasmid stabilization system protein ParE
MRRRPRARLVLRDRPSAQRDVLEIAHRALLKHPLAAQAAITALVSEGRRFAATPAGRRWRARLVGTELVRRGQELWEGSGLGLFDDDPETVLPSALLDSLLGRIAAGDVMSVIKGFWGELPAEVRGRGPASDA